MRRPIRVIADLPNEKLDPMSRIDYGQIIGIPHDVLALAVGRVHSRSRTQLWSDYTEVMSRTLFNRQSVMQPPTVPAGVQGTSHPGRHRMQGRDLKSTAGPSKPSKSAAKKVGQPGRQDSTAVELFAQSLKEHDARNPGFGHTAGVRQQQ